VQSAREGPGLLALPPQPARAAPQSKQCGGQGTFSVDRLAVCMWVKHDTALKEIWLA